MGRCLADLQGLNDPQEPLAPGSEGALDFWQTRFEAEARERETLDTWNDSRAEGFRCVRRPVPQS